MKVIKKKLKRILKDERIKKIIIIALAILVASITTSFCFGIKKAEGGDEKCTSCKNHSKAEDRGVLTKDEPANISEDEDEEDADADDEDLAAEVEDEEDEEGEDSEEKSKKAKKTKKAADENPFKCELTGKTEDDIKTLVSVLKKQHKKIDRLEKQLESQKEQNVILLETVAKINQRFSVMFETQFALSDPASTPERMELALRELVAKKDELIAGISQRNGLISAISVEMKRLMERKRLNKDEQTQLSLYRIQKTQIEKEIFELRGSLEEVVIRAKMIEGRRTQVTGQQPTKPFGPETQATQDPAQRQGELTQPLAQADQLRAIVVALLRKGGRDSVRGGRQPGFSASGAFAPAPNTAAAGRTPAIPQDRRPPLTGRGQRGIVAE